MYLLLSFIGPICVHIAHSIVTSEIPFTLYNELLSKLNEENSLRENVKFAIFMPRIANKCKKVQIF